MIDFDTMMPLNNEQKMVLLLESIDTSLKMLASQKPVLAGPHADIRNAPAPAAAPKSVTAPKAKASNKY